MNLNDFQSYVKCIFYPAEKLIPEDTLSHAEVFFARTKDFSQGISAIKGYVHKDDQQKADRLHYSEEKNTRLLSYTLLRLILSKKLNKDPRDISYKTGANGKPGIKDDLLFFNISHTRDSFAFAISQNFHVGVDLEELNKHIKFEPVIKRFFSLMEGEFILGSTEKSRDSFFLLWTRKEALLKSIGTGIIPHLSEIEVFRPVNHINRSSVNDKTDVPVSDEHYIYSAKLLDFYLSVALPGKSVISLHQLNEENLGSYI